MRKSDEKRERLEKAYKVASRHYRRICAELEEARYYESSFRYELGWECIASNLRKQEPSLMYKLNKIKARVKQYESIHLSALIRLQDYMESIGEPVV